MPDDALIAIISDDMIFARMLVLELARKNLQASVLQSIDIPRDKYGLYIADADFIDAKQAELLADENNIIFYSYRSQEKDADKKNVVWLTRPFFITDFISAVINMLSGEKREKSVPEDNRTVQPEQRQLLLKGNCIVSYGGKNLILTKREYELLEYLYKNRGRAVSRSEAITGVWNYEFTGNTNVVDVYIRYLREKLDEAVGNKLIYTVRNKGYMIK